MGLVLGAGHMLRIGDAALAMSVHDWNLREVGCGGVGCRMAAVAW